MGRGGSETLVLAASLPRVHTNERTQKAAREGPATWRGRKIKLQNAWGSEGELGFPEKEGEEMEDGFWRGGLCSAAQDGRVRVPAAPISEQLKALSVLLRPCQWGLTGERMVFLAEKELKKTFLLQR